MLSLSEIKYWSLSSEEALSILQTDQAGLTEAEAALRLKQFEENRIKSKEGTGPLLLFLSQFKNPIMIILFIATVISGLTGDLIDALIIAAIVFASVILGFIQEYSASKAIEELRSRIQLQSNVLRNGKSVTIPTRYIVPGDIVLLSAGSLIPADGLILKCDDFFVNQAILTGDVNPVEKKSTPGPVLSAISNRNNCVFTGTNVYSGSATMLAVHTGAHTEFGKIAKKLSLRPLENEFERGIRRFGYLLTQIMLILTLAVFAVNVITQKPAIDSLLFSVALAVGITPQLLPAIINITLSKGARTMAQEGVIVRHLTAIENFGSMDILCTDKTGTITEGVVHLDDAVDVEGRSSEKVFSLAYLNSSLQTGLVNSLDQAVVAYKTPDIGKFYKQDEIPYDFSRKRLSIIINDSHECTMITKGALSRIIDICDQIQAGDDVLPLDQLSMENIQKNFEDWSGKGYRVLGIACKTVPVKAQYMVTDEQAMIFCGYLLFYDPPKADVIQTISELKKLGVQLRIITGDSKLVALHIADLIELPVSGILTGAELIEMSDEVLWNAVENKSFCRSRSQPEGAHYSGFKKEEVCSWVHG